MFKKLGVITVCVFALAGCEGGLFGKKSEPITMNTGAIGQSTLGDGSVNDPTSVAFFQQNVGDRVLFLVDQSTLTPQAISVLDGQVNWLQANQGFTVTVEGHADEQGTREYNLALGARRASAVQAYLVSRGITDARVNTITYGKERPLEVCSTEACWSKNRRAVTLLTSGFSS